MISLRPLFLLLIEKIHAWSYVIIFASNIWIRMRWIFPCHFKQSSSEKLKLFVLCLNHCFVAYRNGGNELSPLIGKFCGTKVDSPIFSHSNRMWIKFKSDVSSAAPGFRVWYEDAGEGNFNMLSIFMIFSTWIFESFKTCSISNCLRFHIPMAIIYSTLY